MNEQVFLVDLENVQKVDLARLPENARIKIFVGQQQAKLSTDLFQQALALGPRVELVRIVGNGRNALDFHIACHLGEGICKFPKAEFIILSNDKDFDPVVRHVVARGFKCCRDGQALSASTPKSQLPAHAKAVADLLRSKESKRPKKRAALTNYLTTHFRKKLTAEEIKQAVEHLSEAGLIAGTEAVVTYNF